MTVEEFAELKVYLRGGKNNDGRGDGPLIVLLHGYGASGDDLTQLAEAFPWPKEYRFAFPAAPLQVPDFPIGRMWWPVSVESLQRATYTGIYDDIVKAVPAGLKEAREQILEMIDELKEKLGAPAEDTLFLGGFSQGAVTACDTTFLSNVALRGLIVLSGTFFSEDVWTAAMPTRKGLPVFESHGNDDPIVPFVLAERLRDEMQNAGLAVEWKPFAGGHGIPPETLFALAAFIKRHVERK